MDDKAVEGRRMRSFRLSAETVRLLGALVEKLTEKDGVRKVTITEVVERAVAAMAKKEGVR